MIERVLAPNPGPMTLTGTNTYLVGNDAGELAVIDPGPDDPRHVAAVLQAAARLGPIAAVLVTHRHLDHLPAAQAICERSGAPLIGHADLPGVQWPVGDDELAFGALRALETPGHTRESLCFWEPEQGALFTGDLVAGLGTVVLDDQPGALGQYMASLERLMALEPRTIYPGHGPIAADGLGKLAEYLQHRRQRMQQVVDALTSHGPASVDELVAAIYVDVAPNLLPMAARNVLANLEKLVDDGRVVGVDGGRWQLTRGN
ncbi:MAG: MBL fold metallo-hydrolase [Chloroflexi bacterium]|nr:MBL fold metallo-hydrolase [Chloroflexota bacterium]